MNDSELKTALREMLQTELEAMLYYQQACRFMKDEGALYHFNLLAQEELEHARTFHSVYPGSDLPTLENLVQELPKSIDLIEDLGHGTLAGMTEQSALQLAMELEGSVAEKLRQLLKEVQSPAARAAIEGNIESTLGHLELISEDYRRLFGGDETD